MEFKNLGLPWYTLFLCRAYLLIFIALRYENRRNLNQHKMILLLELVVFFSSFILMAVARHMKKLQSLSFHIWYNSFSSYLFDVCMCHIKWQNASTKKQKKNRNNEEYFSCNQTARELVNAMYLRKLKSFEINDFV